MIRAECPALAGPIPNLALEVGNFFCTLKIFMPALARLLLLAACLLGVAACRGGASNEEPSTETATALRDWFVEEAKQVGLYAGGWEIGPF